MRVPSFAPGTFSRNVLTLAGATGISQVLLIGTGPVLTRLFTPDAFGVFGLVIGFAGVAAVATALCYDQAIVGARTDDDAAALTVASLWLGPLVGLPAVGVLALLIHLRWLGFGIVPTSALWWTGALLVLMQVFVSFRYWQMRFERFSLLGKTTVTQNFGRAIGPIGAVWILPGWVGLVAGETIGRTVGIVPLIRERWDETREVFGRQTLASMRAALRRYAIFAMAGVPSSLLDAVAVALPLPLIASRFGAEAAGQFALAQRVLQAPVGLVGRSIADAFHARIAVHDRERQSYVPTFFRKATALLIAIATLPAVVVLALGDRGFGWIFGARWSDAGKLAMAMLPWAMAQLIVSPLSRAVFVLGGQRQKLAYDISAVLLVGGAYYLATAAGWGLGRTVLWLSLGQTLAYGVYFLILWRIVHREN